MNLQDIFQRGWCECWQLEAKCHVKDHMGVVGAEYKVALGHTDPEFEAVARMFWEQLRAKVDRQRAEEKEARRMEYEKLKQEFEA